jgi:hypothetical protein
VRRSSTWVRVNIEGVGVWVASIAIILNAASVSYITFVILSDGGGRQ